MTGLDLSPQGLTCHNSCRPDLAGLPFIKKALVAAALGLRDLG
ncbi:MAG: hypothetical protein R6U62_02350 [Bacteroidales bacterium]